MIKIVGGILYIIIGFAIALLFQMYMGLDGDEAIMVVLTWPIALLMLIPFIVMTIVKAMYTGFVAIVFSIVAIFKKEGK